MCRGGQIASAMSYLESLNIIHGDLACRNILINGKNIKLCDFGMSREAGHSKVKMDNPYKNAIRWSSPELLRHNQYSSKSDVYAFAVVLWYVFISFQ